MKTDGHPEITSQLIGTRGLNHHDSDLSEVFDLRQFPPVDWVHLPSGEPTAGSETH